MAVRTPNVIHVGGSELATWTSDKIRGGDIDALILSLSIITINVGGGAGVHLDLYGVDQASGAGYLIDQSPDIAAIGRRGFCYGPGAGGGYFRSVPLYIPYEHYFVLTWNAAMVAISFSLVEAPV